MSISSTFTDTEFVNVTYLDKQLDVVVVCPDDLVKLRLLLRPFSILLFLHLLKFQTFTFHHLQT